MIELYPRPLVLRESYGLPNNFKSRNELLEAIVSSWRSMTKLEREMLWDEVVYLESQLFGPYEQLLKLEDALEQFHKSSGLICDYCQGSVAIQKPRVKGHSMMDTFDSDGKPTISCVTVYEHVCSFCRIKPLRKARQRSIKDKKHGICSQCGSYDQLIEIKELSCGFDRGDGEPTSSWTIYNLCKGSCAKKPRGVFSVYR